MARIKEMKKTVYVFLFIALLASCKKDSPNNNSTGKNEIIFVSGTCDIDGQTFDVGFYPLGSYYVDSNYTVVLQKDKLGKMVSIVFKSNSTGTFFGDHAFSLRYGGSVSDRDEFSCFGSNAQILPYDSVVINVTRYDGVGGKIEGNWNGRFRYETLAQFPQHLVNAYGKFSVERGADQ